jgi:hypothetical protein
MNDTSETILDVLDRCCEAFTFPALDNGYWYLAASRLSLFRSDADWAMTIEIFGFSPRAEIPDTAIATFGSRLANRKTAGGCITSAACQGHLAAHPNDELRFVWPIAEGPWIDGGRGEYVSPAAHELRLRSKAVPLPDADDYRHAGVDCADPSRIHIAELCRALAHLYRDDVLATPEERQVNVPPDLQHVLTLDKWKHPDISGTTERPGNSATFQQLADVLVTGDVGLYRPQEIPNTHWRNWPDSGSL